MMKALKIGCLSILGIFAAIILFAVFEPKSCREARITSVQLKRDSAEYYRSLVVKRMALVREKLPYLTEDSMPLPFPPGTINWNSTLQTCEEEVNHFTDSGFVVDPLRYGPWLTLALETIENSYDTTKTRNMYDELKYGRVIQNMKYLMVYVPLYHMQPKVVDKKTFQPGYFDGWMIYVDFESGEPLGYARFQAYTTLYEVKSDKIGVGIGPISVPLLNTTNVQEELTDNFRKEFFKKTDSTFAAFKTVIQ